MARTWRSRSDRGSPRQRAAAQRRPADPDGQDGRRRHRHDPDRPPRPVPHLAGRRRPRRSIPARASSRRRPAHRRPTWTRRPADDPAKFVDFVAGDVDATWQKLFADERQDLRAPRRSSSTTTACSRPAATRRRRSAPSTARATARSISISSFMEQLQQRARRAGRLRAGLHRRARDRPPRPEPARRDGRRRPASSRRTRTTRNELSVRVELQADCLAGVWAHSAYREGRPARERRPRGGAQRRCGGRRRPDPEAVRPGRRIPTRSRTASSEQRVKWFRAGFDRGDPTACDTFKGEV